MIENTIWIAGGAAVAAAHVWMLRQAVRPPFRAAVATAPLRFLLVAALFIAAAWCHELIVAAAGFGAAFLLATLVLLCRDGKSIWATSRSSKNV